jgi:hypothetical protein
VIPDYPHKNAAALCILYAAASLYIGIRYRQRYLAVLGIFAIPFAEFVLTRHLGLDPVVLAISGVSALAGAIKLRRFIGSHPVLPQPEI